MDIQAYIKSGIIESYVLGLTTEDEANEVDRLRLEHREVDEAIERFSYELEQQALQNAIAPPEEIKQKILEAIKLDKEEKDTEAVTLPLQANDVSISGPVRRMRVWRFAAAASIILLLTSAGFNIYLFSRYNRQHTAYEALLNQNNSLQANNQIYQTQLHEWRSAAEMMADTSMAMIKLKGLKAKDNMATIFWDTRNKDVYLMTNKLPKASTGKQYQLWALVDGKPVDAGVLDPACTSVCKMKNIPKAQAFAITLEKAGGSATPTMQQMYVMGNVTAGV